ncbi:MAG: Ku protein [Candidatus Limnocylindria bacterium]|nr:Ku protein [Chloroflexota bacterium]
MPRSIWKGTISFGMVALPVRLYLATESTSKVSFNLLCPEHKARIKNKRWCPEGDHEVAWSDAVRGYEYEKGTYVVLEDEELDALPLASSKSIDIAGFIKDEELPGPLYYQSAYYLEPEKSAQKPYALLKQTLEKTNRVAIAKFALRERERLVSLRALDGALLLNTLHWPDEIRNTEDLDLPEDLKVSPAELKMAENLVEMMAMEFEPDEFKDEYKQAVMKVVSAKIEGREDIVEAPEAAAETTVVDLMAALKASVERAKAGEKKGGREARGGREPIGAPRTGTSKSASSTKERATRRKAS